jgi:hypothetical protein
MPLPPPPNALSLAEFTKRYRAGARTMAELNPEFDQWRKSCGVKGFLCVFVSLWLKIRR